MMGGCNYFFWIFLLLLHMGCKCYDPNTIISENLAIRRAGMDIHKLKQASDYAGGSGCVMRGGRIVYSWGDITKQYDLKSTGKSIAITALGLAIKDGKMHLSDKAIKHVSNFGIPPDENKKKGWLDKITVLNLATHTSGFDKPGGYAPLLFEPGTVWAYSDSGPNWLADCLTHTYRRDLKDLMFERVFTPLGITRSDLTWRDNYYREKSINGIERREFSGIHANVKAMARIGMLYLRQGEWEEQKILPKRFIDSVRSPIAEFADLSVGNDQKSRFQNAPKHYGLLWWNNADGELRNVPKDAYWAWGLKDSTIIVIPSLDIVIARAGGSWSGDRKPSYYKVMEPFLEPIVRSVNFGAHYQNSPVISNIIWDDASNIIRKALGSDNWPLTWADDDNLYMAFGDGYGFDPKINKKLSMGFAKVEGDFPNFAGTNIRSSNEQHGDGDSGQKASGMLSVDGVLYMWVRNFDGKGKQSQLAWSNDYGKTWKYNNWKFKELGYCTFINFGKNFYGSRDNYVYSVSHDHPSAYQRADQFVLMRVLRNRIKNREAYEFFKELDSRGNPIWTQNIGQRGAVFKDSGRCHRSSMSYNAALKRYLWWQAKFPKGQDGKKVGMFGIFDAPEPWGPWTTVYYTENWDVAAGETGGFPTKWMSKDGKTMYLVFSGEDSFSVRKATLTLSPDSNIK